MFMHEHGQGAVLRAADTASTDRCPADGDVMPLDTLPHLPIDHVRAFVVAASEGTFAQTDRVLGLAAGTSSRWCGKLEGALTTLGHGRLLRHDASAQRVTLTPFGKHLLPAMRLLADQHAAGQKAIWETADTFVPRRAPRRPGTPTHTASPRSPRPRAPRT